MKDESKQRPEKDVIVELPGCIAYPAGEGCPVEWCRTNRGDWCKDYRTGRVCEWKRI